MKFKILVFITLNFYGFLDIKGHSEILAFELILLFLFLAH